MSVIFQPNFKGIITRTINRMVWLLFLTTLSFSQAHSQSILDKSISVSFQNQSPENALKKIESAAGIRFSYNSDIFLKDTQISAAFSNVPLHDILDQLLVNKYAYREKGKYIIIKSVQEIQRSQEKFIYTISGYVRDAQTGESIPFASIYDSATLNATLSNELGFYSLNIEQNPGETNTIGISKANYQDTLIMVAPLENKLLAVALAKLEDSIITTDTGIQNLDKNAVVKTLTHAKLRLQALNLNHDFRQGWQISFLPYMGTNGALSGKITNRYSLNILGGYAGGFNGIEAGGIFNIDRDSCRGAQFAGIYNLTAGPFHGAQFSGILNNHFSAFSGAQIAGIANTCSGDIQGFQAAGILNFSKSQLTGTQTAGILNYARNVKGSQIAGIMNTAEHVHGVQIAGLVNTARKIHGMQIGFINIADTVEGLQLGFLSFSKNGVHQVEYAYSDVMQHNAILRTGSKRLYNIISIGYHPYPNEVYSAGYGLGTKFKLSRISALNVEIAGQAMYLGLFEDIHTVFRTSLYHELVLFKTISLIAGPDINLYYSNGLGAPLPGYKSPISYLQPLHTFSLNYNRSAAVWVGFHIGVGLN
jgi:hypothetical protein